MFRASMDALPANRSWQPSCSHGTYQREAITSRSRQLLMMGTWLPETCWATGRREIKNTKVTSSWFFLSTLNYDARSTTHQIYIHVRKFVYKCIGLCKWKIDFCCYSLNGSSTRVWFQGSPDFRAILEPLVNAEWSFIAEHLIQSQVHVVQTSLIRESVLN